MITRKPLTNCGRNSDVRVMPKEQIRMEIFEYIEIWYRKKRRHSYLDYNTITEFNQNYQTINNDAA